MRRGHDMDTFLAYLPFIVFVLALPLAVYVVMTDPNKHEDNPKQAAANIKVAPASSRTGMISYGILAMLFAMIFALTIFSQRGHSYR